MHVHELSISDADGVRTLTLARPDRRNALTGPLRTAIASALARAVADGSRVVVITGAPATPPVFAAGADLNEIAALDARTAWPFAAEGQTLFAAIEDAPALVIAAVDGPCLGGALDLALACDVVACSDRATFAHPGARLGLVTGWGGTRRLPRATSRALAGRMFTTAERLSAREAEAAGLARWVYPTAHFGASVRHLLDFRIDNRTFAFEAYWGSVAYVLFHELGHANLQHSLFKCLIRKGISQALQDAAAVFLDGRLHRVNALELQHRTFQAGHRVAGCLNRALAGRETGGELHRVGFGRLLGG